MDDHDGELLTRIRQVLSQAGFSEIAIGTGGVHVIGHARGVMVGRLPEELVPAPHATGGFAPRELAGTRHAFGLAMAAVLRAAGLAVEPHVLPGPVPAPEPVT